MDNKQNSSAFDVDGRVYQTEYAIKNVSEGGTIIGIKCNEGVVILGINKERSCEKTFEKIYKISDKVYCGFSGIYSDFLKLINHTRYSTQKMITKFKTHPALKTICINLAEVLQIFTQRTGNRPFGVSMLFCSCENDEYKLMSTDPSGTFISWKCKAFGNNDEKINSAFMTDEIPENLSLKYATLLVLKVLKKVTEITEEDALSLEILHFTKEFKGMLTNESIVNLIKECN